MCIRYTGPPMSLPQTHGIRSYFRTHLSGSKGQSMGNLGIESTSHLKGSPFLNPTRCLNCWFFLRISDSPFQGTELFQVKRKLLNLRIITRSQPHYVQHDNLMEMPLKFKAPWIEWLFPFIFQSMNILGLGMNMFSLIMNGLGLSHNPETLPAFCSTPLFFWLVLYGLQPQPKISVMAVVFETSFFLNWAGAWKTIIHSSKNDNICIYGPKPEKR